MSGVWGEGAGRRIWGRWRHGSGKGMVGMVEVRGGEMVLRFGVWRSNEGHEIITGDAAHFPFAVTRRVYVFVW